MKEYPCPASRCSYKDIHPAALVAHMDESHPNWRPPRMEDGYRERRWPCPVPRCIYKGGNPRALGIHMEDSHPSWEPERPPPVLVSLEPVPAPQRPRMPPPEAPARGKLRCAIYARVSTDDGDQDPTQQLEPCRAEAARRGYDVVWEGCDYESGTVELWNRKEGANLWKLVTNHAVDVIITYDASRLSRESASAVMNLLAGLGKRRVGYVSATENILDTASDNDFKDVILAFIAWANNYFVKQLRRSTLRGKAASAARGVPQGRHIYGCGIVATCPTGAHEDGTGRSLRPPNKGGPRGWKKAPPSTSPPHGNGSGSLASGPPESGAREPMASRGP